MAVRDRLPAAQMVRWGFPVAGSPLAPGLESGQRHVDRLSNVPAAYSFGVRTSNQVAPPRIRRMAFPIDDIAKPCARS